MIFIVVYVSACFGFVAYFGEKGALFKVVDVLKLNGDAAITEEAGVTNLALLFFHMFHMSVTALALLISIACGVYVNGGFVTPTSDHPSDLVQINIPFSNLNLAIALGIVFTIVLNVLFKFEGMGGSFMSAVLTSIFLSNKKAKKHVALRLRQLIDRFTVGNSVGPIVSIALIARPQLADSPQHSTRRWAEPSVRYAAFHPEFVNIMDVEETSM